MSTPRRSTTGCTFCKIRRKKCDETKPQCLRCVSSGRSCNYDVVEHPEGRKHWIKRTKPAPRTTGGLSTNAPDGPSAGSINATLGSLPTFSGYRDSTSLTSLTPLRAPCNDPDYTPSFIAPWDSTDPLSLLQTSSIPSQQQPYIDPLSLIPVSSTPSWQQFNIAQASNVPPGYDIPISSGSTSEFSAQFDFEDDDNDIEGVKALLWATPTLDKNIKENTLAFVLQCYSQWVIAVIFEPLKLVDIMRDEVPAHISSEDTRMRTILIANVMNMHVKNLAIDVTRKSIIEHLAWDVRKGCAAKPPCIMPGSDRQAEMRTLGCMLEVLSLQLNTQPMSDCVQSLEYAAPVFQRACFESPGQFINLPNILLDPNVHLRHFASLDILMSMTCGRPTVCRYQVPLSAELCERIYYWQLQGNYGLQWLYGLPDQFALLLAWINSSSEALGADNSWGLIAWIEELLPRIKISIDQSGDPLLRVSRMVVIESWRFAVIIYLYMVLGRVDARYPRVIQAQKSFMRLIKTVKPGRTPDTWLVMPMTVVGVVTTDEQDRDTLRRRFFNAPVCARRGTAANDNVLALEDIWARTRDEGRAAVWSDLRIAHSRFSGR